MNEIYLLSVLDFDASCGVDTFSGYSDTELAFRTLAGVHGIAECSLSDNELVRLLPGGNGFTLMR